MTNLLAWGDDDCIKIIDKRYKGPIVIDKSYEERTVKSICYEGFAKSYITSIDMHATSITTINIYAFRYTSYLTEVLFPQSLKEIHNYAFHGSMVQELNFGPNIKYIGDSALEGWNISNIAVDETNPYFFVEDNCLYTTNRWLIRASIKSTHLRDDIIGIAQACFNSAKFQILNFTESLETLSNFAFFF